MDILLALETRRYEDIAEGKVLVSTSEGGGTASFSIPDGITTGNLATYCTRARRFLAVNPGMIISPSDYIPRRIMRRRASFARAQTS